MEEWTYVQQLIRYKDGYSFSQRCAAKAISNLKRVPKALLYQTITGLVSSFKATSILSEKELFGFIAESDRQIVIVFRGTSTTSDWISDAIARQIRFPIPKSSASFTKGFSTFTIRPANKS